MTPLSKRPLRWACLIFSLVFSLTHAALAAELKSASAKPQSHAHFESIDTASAEHNAKKPVSKRDLQTQPDPPVVVAQFIGPNGNTVRKWTITALQEGGVPHVGKGAATKMKPSSSQEDFELAAEEDEALAIIAGTVVLRKGAGFSVKVVVHNGYDGEKLGEFTIRGGLLPNLKKKILGSLVKELQEPLKEAVAPEIEYVDEAEDGTSAEEDEDEDLDEDEDEDEGDEGPSGPRPSPLDLRANLRLFARSFSYTGTLAQTFPEQNFPPLLTYSLAGAPSAGLHLNWYPVAHFEDGFWAHMGITGGFEQGFAMQSRGAMGESIETFSYNFYVGPRARLPIDDHQIGMFAAFGKHEFILSEVGAPLIPDVQYSIVDVGVDSRFVFGDIGLGPYVKYRIVSDTGPLQASYWFPNARGAAIDVGVRATYSLTAAIEIVAGFEYLQYGFDFNPINPSETVDDGFGGMVPLRDAQIAGGAKDVYVSGYVGMGFRLPETK